MKSRFLVLVAVLTLGLTGLVAVGCGDDDDDDGESTAAGELDLLNEGTLTVGTDTPYPPFEFGDPPGYEGFDIDLINAVAEEMGLETEFIDVPFDVVLQGGEGRFDLAVAATTIKPARENRVDFSDPYFESEQSLLVLSDGDVQSVDDITSDTVVGAQDGTTGEEYANAETDAEVRGFPEIDDAYNALTGGQVDAVLNDLSSTADFAEQNPDTEVVETFPTDEQYGIVFAQGSTLIEPVNEALQAIKDDGRLNDIYQEWFGVEAPAAVLEGTHEPT